MRTSANFISDKNRIAAVPDLYAKIVIETEGFGMRQNVFDFVFMPKIGITLLGTE